MLKTPLKTPIRFVESELIVSTNTSRLLSTFILHEPRYTDLGISLTADQSVESLERVINLELLQSLQVQPTNNVGPYFIGESDTFTFIIPLEDKVVAIQREFIRTPENVDLQPYILDEIIDRAVDKFLFDGVELPLGLVMGVPSCSLSAALFHWHVADLGMEHVYIKPRTPQLNGKVERSHRTDKDEFYQLLTYKDDVDLDKKLAVWERFYNNDRPHGAHKGKTPYEVLKEKLS